MWHAGVATSTVQRRFRRFAAIRCGVFHTRRFGTCVRARRSNDSGRTTNAAVRRRRAFPSIPDNPRAIYRCMWRNLHLPSFIVVFQLCDCTAVRTSLSPARSRGCRARHYTLPFIVGGTSPTWVRPPFLRRHQINAHCLGARRISDDAVLLYTVTFVVFEWTNPSLANFFLQL